MARLPRHFQLPDNGVDQLVHCFSRVVDRQFVFGDLEKEVFAKILRRVEGFSGVRVVTWTILDNHFHLLVYITPPPEHPMTEEQTLKRISKLYTREQVKDLRTHMETVRSSYGTTARGDAMVLEELQPYVLRMHNISEFLKTLKQRFTMWFNLSRDRTGTLWETRFKSVLVENDHYSALKVAAYIDLNAVRAGIVDDPKDYRWCGYGEAVVGVGVARSGLSSILELVGDGGSWSRTSRVYRDLLFGIGEECSVDENGHPLKKSISSEEVRQVQAAGGKLGFSALLRCRIRYFTDGLVIGSAAFVDDFYSERRACFGRRRKTGARRMRGGNWGNLCSFRDLRKNPVT